VEKRIVARRPKFWHVAFVSPEKRCSEVLFFRWVAIRFKELMNAKRARRLEELIFFASTISQK